MVKNRVGFLTRFYCSLFLFFSGTPPVYKWNPSFPWAIFRPCDLSHPKVPLFGETPFWVEKGFFRKKFVVSPPPLNTHMGYVPVTSVLCGHQRLWGALPMVVKLLRSSFWFLRFEDWAGPHFFFFPGRFVGRGSPTSLHCFTAC